MIIKKQVLIWNDKGEIMPRKKSEDSKKLKREDSKFKQSKSDITVIEVSKPSSLPRLEAILESLPKDLVENLPLVLNRLNALIAFYSTINLSRLDKLTSFIVKAEELLFDEDQLLSMDRKELSNTYKAAISSSNEILELSRKIADQVQAESKNKDVDEVYALLESMSPEQLAEIKALLKQE